MSADIHVVIEHVQGEVAEISYVMLGLARTLARGTGGQVVALLLGHEARDLAADLAADRVLYVDHPELSSFTSEAYRQVLAGLLADRQARAVLFGDTTIGADLAGVLSAQLELPLVSHCLALRAEGDEPVFVSRICGGKILAEGSLPAPTALLLVLPGGSPPEDGRSEAPPPVEDVAGPALTDLRVTMTQFTEPEAGDVDISKEPILIAVGRGIQQQDNIELAEQLAEQLGGVVCSSRPVIDQGWLPATRLVGSSGKRVAPKLYLALGISGAPEHVESITGSDTIVAINTDPAAPIFDVAQYGAEVDMLDLLEVLCERVEEAKGG